MVMKLKLYSNYFCMNWHCTVDTIIESCVKTDYLFIISFWTFMIRDTFEHFFLHLSVFTLKC